MKDPRKPDGLIGVLILLGLGLAACRLVTGSSTPFASQMPVSTTSTPAPVPTVGAQPVIVSGVGDDPAVIQFVARLTQHGFRAEPVGPSVTGFDLPPGQVYKLYDGDFLGPVHIYLFPDDQAAKSAAATIPTGEDLGRASEWGDYPHFFLCQNLIVLYIGRAQSVLNALQGECGPAFADFGK